MVVRKKKKKKRKRKRKRKMKKKKKKPIKKAKSGPNFAKPRSNCVGFWAFCLVI
jgi:hypothetical protein